jgi:phosphatidylinositol alpha-1,6-mannosyltransferase
MRVLLLTPELLSIGGIQRQNRLLIAALDELLMQDGGKLRVLALNDSPEKRLDQELSILQVANVTCFGGDRWAYARRFISEAWHADLIFYGLVGFTLLDFALVVLKHSRCRLLVVHGIEAWQRRSSWHALAVRRMDGYASVSQYTLDRFASAYRVSPVKKRFLLPNVVSPNLLEEGCIQASALVAGRPPNLLTVGRMYEHDGPKGIDTVLHALPSLVQRFPTLRYTVIGDGPDRERLEGLASSLGVVPHVDFLGHVSEEALQEAYRCCTAFVMPSAKEGFGFVYIEAMAHGKPVVAARATAVPEVVLDGETGILVEYGEISQLIEAITTLLEDTDLCRRMGQAGQERVRTHFSYDNLKANLAHILACVSDQFRQIGVRGIES